MKEELNEKDLKALSSGTRRKILKILKEKGLTPTVISKKTGKHKSTVTEHLNILKDSGFVEKDKVEGRKRVVYSLTRKGKAALSKSSNIYLVLVLPILGFISGSLILLRDIWSLLFPAESGQEIPDQGAKIMEQTANQTLNKTGELGITTALNNPLLLAGLALTAGSLIAIAYFAWKGRYQLPH